MKCTPGYVKATETLCECYRATPLAMTCRSLLNPPTRLQYLCFRNWPCLALLTGSTGWHCGRFFPRDRLHACGHKRCHRPYLSGSDADWRKKYSSAAIYEAIVLYARTPSNEVGLIMRLCVPNKEMHYKYLHKIDRLEVEIVHILVIITLWHRITAIVINHGTRRKSR